MLLAALIIALIVLIWTVLDRAWPIALLAIAVILIALSGTPWP